MAAYFPIAFWLSETLVSDLQALLQQTGDFLALTRAHAQGIAQPFQFLVTHAATNQAIHVNVLDTGIISFEPEHGQDSKDIVLSSAVHGNETAPIEICNTLIQKLILGQLPLAQRVLFLFGNPPAINLGERFVTENLNRLFSGGHSKDQGQGQGAGLINAERHRALLLENTVREFFQQGASRSAKRQRLHYDLHTAIRGSKNDKFAVYPFRHGKPWDKQQLQFLLACGVSTILLSKSPTTTFSYFSSNEFDAEAFTVELGKVRPFGENEMVNFQAAADTLQALISQTEITLPAYQAQLMQIFEIAQIINRSTENFTLHFNDDVENFTDFPVGTVIATDGELQHKIAQAGEAIIFPNAQVALGQRALLTVVPTQID
jgi:succinylglutamate desuccinylase